MKIKTVTEIVSETAAVEYEPHPLTEIVPEMSPADIAKLEQDIFRNEQLEPIVIYRGKILDGRGRQKACKRLRRGVKYEDYKGREDDASLLRFIISKNQRRDLNKSQRAYMAVEVEKVFAEIGKANMRAGGGDKRSHNATGCQKIDHPIRAADEAANICGSNRTYVSKLKQLRRENGDEIDGLFQEIRRGRLNVPDVTNLINEPPIIRANALAKFNAAKIMKPGKRINVNKLIREAKREEQSRIAESLLDSGEHFKLIRASFVELITQIPGDSIDLIFADPWYHGKHLSGYEDLAKLALHALKPGGSLLAMTGNLYLKEILNLMTPYLMHQGTFAYLMPGRHSRLCHNNVEADWKPVFWFTKDEYLGPCVTSTVVESEKSEKDRHPYQQSVSGITALLKAFPHAKKIMDPCVGSGTTAIAALKLGLRFIGADIDQGQINCTKIEVDKLLNAAAKDSAIETQELETTTNTSLSANIPFEVEAEIDEQLNGNHDEQSDGGDMGVIGNSLFSIAA